MSAAEIAYNKRLIVGVTTFCELIGVVSCAARLLARRLSKATLWWDDYVMGIGLVKKTQSETTIR